MITLQPSSREELAIFDEMDRQDHASKFVNQIGLDTHREWFDNPNITYLRIENESGENAGYFILVAEVDTESVEFRRILIDKSRRGVGQGAITQMEIYCKKEFNAKRIWLDVYEDNVIGRHIYEKMGYQPFKVEVIAERKLLFYEKGFK